MPVTNDELMDASLVDEKMAENGDSSHKCGSNSIHGCENNGSNSNFENNGSNSNFENNGSSHGFENDAGNHKCENADIDCSTDENLKFSPEDHANCKLNEKGSRNLNNDRRTCTVECTVKVGRESPTDTEPMTVESSLCHETVKNSHNGDLNDAWQEGDRLDHNGLVNGVIDLNQVDEKFDIGGNLQIIEKSEKSENGEKLENGVESEMNETSEMGGKSKEDIKFCDLYRDSVGGEDNADVMLKDDKPIAIDEVSDSDVEFLKEEAKPEMADVAIDVTDDVVDDDDVIAVNRKRRRKRAWATTRRRRKKARNTTITAGADVSRKPAKKSRKTNYVIEVIAEPASPSEDQGDKFECLCGVGTDVTIQDDKTRIQCSDCGLWQHSECMGYHLHDRHRSVYRCPHCCITAVSTHTVAAA